MLTKTTFALSVAMALAAVTGASAASRPAAHNHMVKIPHQLMTRDSGRAAFASVRGVSAGDAAIAIQDRFYRESN